MYYQCFYSDVSFRPRFTHCGEKEMGDDMHDHCYPAAHFSRGVDKMIINRISSLRGHMQLIVWLATRIGSHKIWVAYFYSALLYFYSAILYFYPF